MTNAMSRGLRFSVEEFNSFRVLEHPHFKNVAPHVFLPRLEPKDAVQAGPDVVFQNVEYVDLLDLQLLDVGSWQLRRV